MEIFPEVLSPIFFNFGLFEKTIWGGLSKLHSIIPEDRLVKKSLFQVKCLFSIFFRTWSRHFWTVGIIVLAGLLILHSLSPGEPLEDKKALKREFFVPFRFWAKNTCTLAKFYWLPSLNCILPNQRNFHGNFSSGLITWTVKFRLSAKYFWGAWQNCFLCALTVVLEEKRLFSKIVFFSTICRLRANVSWTSGKKTGGVAVFPFDEPRGTIWGNQVFFQKKLFLLFHTLSKKTFGKRQNCILRDQRSFFGKFPWGSMSYFIYFALFEKILRRIYRNRFLWALRIVLNEKEFFFKKFITFLCFSDLELNVFQLLAEKSCHCGQTSVRCAQRKSLRRTMFLQKLFFVFQTSSKKRSDNGQNFWLRPLSGILVVQKNIFCNFFLKFIQPFWHIQTFWGKNWAFVKTAFYHPRRSSCKKKSFSSKVFFPTFSDLEQTFLGLLAKKLAWWPKIRWMSPQEHIKENIVFQKISFFFFKHWVKNVRKRQNCILCDQGSFFGKFPWGSMSYFIYFALFEKILRRIYRNRFLWALRIVLKEKEFFFKKFITFLVFRTWS